MFTMQMRPQAGKAAGNKRKKAYRSFAPVNTADGEGVIQRVKYQYHGGKWNAVSDFDRGPREVPGHIPTEEGGVYDTVTGEYVSPAEAHRRAHTILEAARRHQVQRAEIAAEQGVPLPPRNRSEMYSTKPMEEGPFKINTPFASSTARAGFFRQQGSTRKQPYIQTPGVVAHYKGQAAVIDGMPQEKRSAVVDTMGRWFAGTGTVEAPEGLLESMTKDEKAVASQMAVCIGVAEPHFTRANEDGGKMSRASVRMLQDYPAGEVLDPQKGHFMIGRTGGNKLMREAFSDEAPHTPPRGKSFAPMYPYLSPSSPSPQRRQSQAPPDETEEAPLTDEDRQLWLSAARRIARYMENDATPRDREIFDRQIGLAAIYSWIADPGQMTRKDIRKLMQFL